MNRYTSGSYLCHTFFLVPIIKEHLFCLVEWWAFFFLLAHQHGESEVMEEAAIA